METDTPPIGGTRTIFAIFDWARSLIQILGCSSDVVVAQMLVRLLQASIYPLLVTYILLETVSIELMTTLIA